jgi:L-threonylcarbamoyladenylate synthase
MRVLNWADSPDQTLTAAVECLRQGGLVAFPTDTLYGLGVDAGNDKAVDRLFQAKRRPPEVPLPILIATVEQAATLTESMPALALKLGYLYWPGPLTMVLERSPAFESLALAGGDSVALRVPDHAVPLALIRSLGRPVTGTSANRSGQPAPRTADEVVEQLDGDVDIVIDAGPCPLGIESTVVDLRGDAPRLLREGAIRREDLESATGVRFDVAEE